MATWNRDLKNAINLIEIEGLDLETLNSVVLKKLQKDYENLHSHLNLAMTSFNNLLNVFKKSAQFIGLDTVKGLNSKASNFISQLDSQISFLNPIVLTDSKVNDISDAIEAISFRSEIKNKLHQNQFIKELLSEHYQGTDTNCDDILDLISAVQLLLSQNLLNEIKVNLISGNFIESIEENIKHLEALEQHLVDLDKFVVDISAYGEFDLSEWSSADLKDDLVTFVYCYEMSLFKAVENTQI